jgi:hypothetical protein
MTILAKKRAPRTKDSSAPKPKRNHKAESSKALANRVERVAVLREHRDAGILGDDLMQVAQSLILVGLPYKPTKETRITRKARMADGSTVSVTFSAALEDNMPYGTDRSLLHYLLDRAVKTGSRHISWKSAVQFLEHMGMTVCGKNYADLRQRFDRSALPSSMDIRNEQEGRQLLPLSDDDPFGVEIDELFFNDLMAWHVPVPTQLIIQTRTKPQLQDVCIWLHWRCFAAQSESTIPWPVVVEQMRKDDSNLSRIKARFAEAIRFARGMWPEIQAEARKDGLWIAPPRNGKHLLIQGQSVRRLG